MQHIKVDLKEVSLQEKGLLIIKMEAIILAIFMKEMQMDKVFIFILMDQYMKGNSKDLNLMVRDH